MRRQEGRPSIDDAPPTVAHENDHRAERRRRAWSGRTVVRRRKNDESVSDTVIARQLRGHPERCVQAAEERHVRHSGRYQLIRLIRRIDDRTATSSRSSSARRRTRPSSPARWPPPRRTSLRHLAQDAPERPACGDRRDLIRRWQHWYCAPRDRFGDQYGRLEPSQLWYRS